MSQTVEVSMPATQSRLPPQIVALVAPDVGMPRVAADSKARWAIAFAMICSLAFTGAQALRVNAREQTLQELEMGGQLKDMSDRQIDEQSKGAERKFIVTSTALSLIKPGALCLAYLGCLYLLSWFLHGRSKGTAVAAVAGAVLLPGAIRDLLSAGSAFMHSTLPTNGPALIPSTLTQILQIAGKPLMGTPAALGNALDFFSLWAAVMFAFGLAAAANLSKRVAIPAALIAWVLWRLLFACVLHLGG